MKTRWEIGLVIVTVAVLGVAVATAGQVLQRGATAGAEPQQVVQGFYDRLLAQEGNYLVSKEYYQWDELSPALARHVDETVEGFYGGGYDPLLCAQDRPLRVMVSETARQGAEATMTVTSLWAGNPVASNFEVQVRQERGGWRMVAVHCDRSWHAPLDAAQTAQAFYDLYLDASSRRNLLASGAYRDMPFLTAEFVAQVDELIAGFDRGGYDPFLLAQDLPSEMRVQSAEVQGDAAQVVVQSSLGHRVLVSLAARDGHWWIHGIAPQA